ncbi:MAG: GGDEF domain-containing response regulator [Lentisphaerae bacterium]|nr:GGDEF domain-containing response regulator [Lentisphaerota bacterium]
MITAETTGPFPASGQKLPDARRGADGQLSKAPADYIIVIMDDEEHLAELLASIIRTDGYQVFAARNEAELKHVLDSHPPPDLVVMDLFLGENNREGLTLIQNFEEYFGVSTGFFVISGRGDMIILEELLRLGRVWDFMEKPLPAKDFHQFRLRIRTALLRQEREARNGLDAMLNIPNRGMLDDKLDEQIRIWGRHLRKALQNPQYGQLDCYDLSLVLFDLDDFKKFNDRYGHRQGDYVLIEVASGISSRLRAGDFLARYGGEEFGIIMPGTNTLNAQAAVTRHAWEFANQSRQPDKGLPDMVTFSAGIATLTFDLYVRKEFLNSTGIDQERQNRDDAIRAVVEAKNHLINASDWALLQVKEMKKAAGGAFRGHCYPGNGLDFYTPGAIAAGRAAR